MCLLCICLILSHIPLWINLAACQSAEVHSNDVTAYHRRTRALRNSTTLSSCDVIQLNAFSHRFPHSVISKTSQFKDISYLLQHPLPTNTTRLAVAEKRNTFPLLGDVTPFRCWMTSHLFVAGLVQGAVYFLLKPV